ncbi:MAG: DUF3221 domain-containing protein [Bacillota bacterium]|nr:DUF3221 domain-containing protein [Bacillota bacterium]
MKKKISILLVLSLLVLTLAACSSQEEAAPPNIENDPPSANDSQLVEYGVAGHIVDITVSENDDVLGTIQVEGPENNGAEYDKAIVTVKPSTKIYLSDLTSFDSLEVGMYVAVFFDGPARESYPVQADAKQINIIPDE